MKERKERKIRIIRVSIPQTSEEQIPGVPTGLPLGALTEIEVQSDEDQLPLYIYEVGDRIDKEGFIDLLRIDELGYSPEVPAGQSAMADRLLEFQTYCLVRISSKVDASANVVEFRILYSDVKGEQLAASMAVIAVLKDAFINRAKVRIHGEVSQREYGAAGPRGMKSSIYNALKSVDLIRS